MNDRQAVPDTVFERDGFACVHCGADGELDVYAVDDPPVDEGESHPDRLVTVCRSCRTRLDGGHPSWAQSTASTPATVILQFLREVTTTQGEAVADVADFAAAATNGVDTDDPTARRSALDARRRIRLALTVVDSSLDVAADHDWGSLDEDVADAVAEVVELATTLQHDLDAVVALAETAITATGHCHACLEPFGDEACDRCETPTRDTTAWEDDGEIALSELYGAINDRLRETSGRTGQLTERTGQLAERLVDPV